VTVGEAGVAVAVGVPVGVFVGVSVGVPVGVTVGVSVGVPVGVSVGVSVGVPVGVSVGVFVGVSVGVPVGVTVGVSVGVPVGVSVGVLVGVSVGVPVGVSVGVSVGVCAAGPAPADAGHVQAEADHERDHQAEVRELSLHGRSGDRPRAAAQCREGTPRAPPRSRPAPDLRRAAQAVAHRARRLPPFEVPPLG
jgi:hypothetical protein